MSTIIKLKRGADTASFDQPSFAASGIDYSSNNLLDEEDDELTNVKHHQLLLPQKALIKGSSSSDSLSLLSQTQGTVVSTNGVHSSSLSTGGGAGSLSYYNQSSPTKKDQVSCLFEHEYTSLPLRPDAVKRPLWVCNDGKIYLEAFSPISYQAQDFLITIAEPISRPSRIHEYRLTAYSLYAAVAVGMDTEAIIDVLSRFSKVDLPKQVVSFIRDCTMSYGKVKLVLKQNRFFVESNYPEIIRKLLKDEVIEKAQVHSNQFEHSKVERSDSMNPSGKFHNNNHQTSTINNNNSINGNLHSKSMTLADESTTDTATIKVDDGLGAVITLDKDDNDTDDDSEFTQAFEIDKNQVEEVKKRCVELDFPLMEEYDFRNDTLNATLDMDLSPKCIIRDYQEKSLSKMFGGGGGRARSGIIVLPTGAGKTLVGITAACTIKKSTLVLCTNALSVEQWANEFRHWTTIKDNQIAKFTADSKSKFQGDAGLVVSTYTMITHSGKRAWETAKMIEFINNTEWGLVILDEVHVVPANVFRRVLTMVAAQTKLGLTATLVREDDKIQDLNFLIGPKLYEANWMDLANRRHIARAEVTEIYCPMTGPFFKQFLMARSGKRRLLTVMNPTKVMACQYLIQWREREADKIIVFSDNVFALMHYARTLKKPFIYGGTSHEERTKILQLFRQGHPSFRTIFLSKVGDTSLDLPEATCLIQISAHFGSRRQEAQRMGRILRAKRRTEEGFKSRFFSLISKDTDEVYFSTKRKTFLIDQGYEYHVIYDINDLIPADIKPTLNYCTKKEQDELLNLVMEQTEEAGDEENITTSVDDLSGLFQQKRKVKNSYDEPFIKRFAANSSGANGCDTTTKSKKEREASMKKRNPLFRQWAKK